MPSDLMHVAALRRWAVLLDSAFKVPGLPVRFGLDAILGLIPGLGELTTPVFTIGLLVTGVRMRLPAVVLVRMALNAGFDALIGLVPILGDLADIGFKANLRNLALLERHATPGTPATRGDALFVGFGAALIGLVVVIALIPIFVVAWVLAWVISQRGLI